LFDLNNKGWATTLNLKRPSANATDTDCADKYTDQDSCDADDDCAWCVSAAVPSSCETLEDAKSLPPSVFACDKV